MYTCIYCVLCCVGTDHPALKELYRHVKKLIAAKWFEVGVELFEENDIKQLITIKSNYAGNADACCAEMLLLWHEQYPNVTWEGLIIALKSPGVALNETASKIEEMLLPSEKCK